MVDVLAASQRTKGHAESQGRSDESRTLAGISTAHWVSHFHMFVLPMLFPFLKQQLGVDYIQLGFALTLFAVISGLTQAPIGYLVDLSRGISRATADYHAGKKPEIVLGRQLAGSRLGIIGYGSIGRNLAPVAKSLSKE